tara:strand:+ start:902 stop:1141 length:240 start_codon:yes stop_codon:yes gene_type:complete
MSRIIKHTDDCIENYGTIHQNGQSHCDECGRCGNFNDGDLYGFSGFSRQELDEIGLSHISEDEDAIKCSNCLTNKKKEQ